MEINYTDNLISINITKIDYNIYNDFLKNIKIYILI